ncbi:phage major capsid protein [Bradyrhizobium sp. SRL28]|uniref:phage major capsid protein n=1 Tax=Bradyrhizobium sp. SRL28 TaxID=2836178 RepID=UPI001BDF02BC|nr:phage major capsid protein [Bradyrhizobium sp. SRL28]MBT1512565.1 phage major capsid protein [Bradyrhizobium sp. SRL28]
MRHATALSFPPPSSKTRLPPAVARKQLKPRDVIVRAATCEILRRRGVHTENSPALVERVYPGCEPTALYIAKAATSPAMTTVPGWAQELVIASNVDFIDSMAATSAFAALSQRALTLTGVKPRKIPSRVHPFALVGGWIGEGKPIPVASLGLTATTLTPYKLAALSTFTEEMQNYSIPEIELIVRQALQHDLGALLDQALLSADAATPDKPAGIFNGVTPITKSAATPLTDAMLADLGALTAAVGANAPDAQVVFVANPVQALRMRAAGLDIISSGFMAVGSVGAIDAGALVLLVDDIRFSASGEAVLHMETVPLPLSAVGTPNTVAAPMASLFQIDAVALRSIQWTGWKLRRTGAAAIVNSVTW